MSYDCSYCRTRYQAERCPSCGAPPTKETQATADGYHSHLYDFRAYVDHMNAKDAAIRVVYQGRVRLFPPNVKMPAGMERLS